MAVLEVSNLASGYGEVQILWGVDFTLEQGKLTTLVGSNGVGKTTLLRTIMGLLRPIPGIGHLCRPGCHSPGASCPGQPGSGPGARGASAVHRHDRP